MTTRHVLAALALFLASCGPKLDAVGVGDFFAGLFSAGSAGAPHAIRATATPVPRCER